MDEVRLNVDRFCLLAGIEALQEMMEEDAAAARGIAAMGDRRGYRWGTATSGMRLSEAQRQKNRDRDVPVEATRSADHQRCGLRLRQRVWKSAFKNVRDGMKDRSLIWVGSEVARDSGLGRVFSMAGGKVVDGGRASAPSSACSARSRSFPASTAPI